MGAWVVIYFYLALLSVATILSVASGSNVITRAVLVLWASWLIPLLAYLAGSDIRVAPAGLFSVVIALAFWMRRRGRPLYSILAVLFALDASLLFLKGFAVAPAFWVHFALNRVFELMIAAIAISSLDIIKRRQTGKLHH